MNSFQFAPWISAICDLGFLIPAMFTPQRKIWSGWPLSPPQKNDVSGSGPDPKGKSVAFLDSTPPPPVGFLGQNGGTEESPASVVHKISKLENEVRKY